MAELIYKIANEPAPDIRIIRAELSEKLANVVALSISKKPEARYQDGDQFAADLRALMGEMSGLANTASTTALPGNTSAGTASSTNFDTTMVQSATVYDATQKMQAETAAFVKTNISPVRDTGPKV